MTAGHTIAPPATLDELRTLADQFYALVWLGYQRVTTAQEPRGPLPSRR